MTSPLHRLALAALPFAVIPAVFAAAVARHLAGPSEPAARFDWLLSLAGDAPVGPVADADFVGLHRAGAADYVVRVRATGLVEFTGRDRTCALGERRTIVTRVKAQRLVAALRDVGFAGLPAFGAPSSGPLSSIALQAGADVHEVTFAADAPSPDLLGRAAAAIDDVSGDARWLPQRAEDGTLRCIVPSGFAPPLRAASAASAG
jgi:hypothetical protein